MIDSSDILIELMDELGWDYVQEWTPTAEQKLLFEKRLSEIEGSVEIESGIFFTPSGVETKRFTVKGRKISWGPTGDLTTVDLAHPDSIEEIARYASR